MFQYPCWDRLRVSELPADGDDASREKRVVQEDGMEDIDAFVSTTVARLKAADTALHNGDANPRKTVTWSHANPVTVFGAAMSANGWDEIGPMFDQLATRFSDCESFEIEVIAAGLSGDLAYVAAIERTTGSIYGEPQSYALRVTQVFRREDGEWRVVHRHADTLEGADVRRRLLQHDEVTGQG